MIPVTQKLIQLPGAYVPRSEQDPGGIIRLKDLNLLKLCLLTEMTQNADIMIKEFVSMLSQLPDAGIYGSHQHVAGTAGLEDGQHGTKFSAVCNVSVHMQQCCLRKGRQGLVKAVDDDIRSQCHG